MCIRDRLIVLGMLVKLGNEVVEGFLRIIDFVDLFYSFFGLVDHIMRSEPVSLEPNGVNELCHNFPVMDVFQPLRKQSFLPLFRLNLTPNAVIQPRLEFLIIEIPMNIGQYLRNFI